MHDSTLFFHFRSSAKCAIPQHPAPLPFPCQWLASKNEFMESVLTEATSLLLWFAHTHIQRRRRRRSLTAGGRRRGENFGRSDETWLGRRWGDLEKVCLKQQVKINWLLGFRAWFLNGNETTECERARGDYRLQPHHARWPCNRKAN